MLSQVFPLDPSAGKKMENQLADVYTGLGRFHMYQCIEDLLLQKKGGKSLKHLQIGVMPTRKQFQSNYDKIVGEWGGWPRPTSEMLSQTWLAPQNSTTHPSIHVGPNAEVNAIVVDK